MPNLGLGRSNRGRPGNGHMAVGHARKRAGPAKGTRGRGSWAEEEEEEEWEVQRGSGVCHEAREK
eukprot:8747092-Pyramimonas_sp.AAC.1